MLNNEGTSIYLPAMQAALPRVFSMLDREPVSQTFGCADRTFWAWKFTDFSGARFQEIAYVLAVVTTNPQLLSKEGVQQDTLLAWAKAAIAYWCQCQHRDGSFDEAYPYERSLAATAFTSFYVGQAYLIIKNTYSAEEQLILDAVFSAAGRWLCCNNERHGILSNHLAAAAAALHTIAEITHQVPFIQRRDYFIERIYQHQSAEGWYEEYGGADPGYQTHTTFYLAYIWTQTQDLQLLASLTKSIQYFWHFVHADGSIGGEYASRNTRFYMPAGFEMLAGIIPEAAAVAKFMRDALLNQNVIGLSVMDTQNIFPLINNYIFSLKFSASLAKQPIPLLPYHDSSIHRFVQSGHIVITTPNFQTIIGAAKGGVVNIFSKEEKYHRAAWSNAGIVLELVNGKKISSQGLDCSHVTYFNHESVEIESHFVQINQMLMSVKKFIAFRIVNLISASFPAFAYYLKNILVKALVCKKKSYAIRLIRKICWDNSQVSVHDEIILDKEYQIKNILFGGRFSVIHMGSSRYFEWQELSHPVLTKNLPMNQVDQLNEQKKIVINSKWSVINEFDGIRRQPILQ